MNKKNTYYSVKFYDKFLKIFFKEFEIMIILCKSKLIVTVSLLLCVKMSFGMTNNFQSDKKLISSAMEFKDDKPLIMAIVGAFVRYHELLKSQKFLSSTKQKIALHNYKVLQSVLDDYLVEKSVNNHKLMELIPVKIN